MKKTLIIALAGLTLILSGCVGNRVKPVVVVAENAPKSLCRGVPKADRIITRDIEWFIIKDENDIFWIALLPKHYENLALNTQELLRLAKQQKKIIKFYENCLRDEPKKKDTKK